MTTEQTKIVLTGIKPSGELHLGNYLGAIEPALAEVTQHRGFYFIADYHALTTVRDPIRFEQQIYELAAAWLALGLNPDQVVFYRQSQVSEIFELFWILACVTPKGMLNRAHAYKAAMEQNQSLGQDVDFNVQAGLYNYPILMAADILAFDTDIVPVGQDQKQHLEMARDMANSINAIYGPVLKLPEAKIREQVKTVPGIDGQKMSKSYDNVIPIFASGKTLRKRIMSIVTDSKGLEESKDPDSCNLFAIYRYFADPEAVQATRQKYLDGGLGYGYLKQELFELLEFRFKDQRDYYYELLADKSKLDQILAQGAEEARAMAIPVLKRVRKAIGII
ncbi:tryptophan--tRNA ligase-like [Ylistrum balloti]|uniref:tryptophan--tRNA ligase-like n=1 Tax=Ylistrum balloti TaxID=509963 RepID=UPI0029058EF7|nr:tryptophan--tRNA ligase-like [Ylistrum balloti]